MNDDFMKRFEERMSEKKAAEPKLHRFDCEFRISLLAKDEETAADTVKILEKHLMGFDDIEKAEGKLK